ncbi:uncharacterized protein LOC127797073 [Diospyros lotus]|uniref:uncharacterized protein LOC127797073 n=1 Tax=Diospyros lotus TaxID=55363 RepID=UPI0022549DD5|nr:uncharacterized protein LOC127797073 [Diospyros lotus]XP_052185538.1 uncharacterized protein LOC127797073 [Diospyros lotus]XP_052185539.1 uncharacterized protein LOC127797073 [Diospyros lotus]
MDSLLANYASSDEEAPGPGHLRSQNPDHPSESAGRRSPPSSKIFSSLFSSLPPPKSHLPIPTDLSSTKPTTNQEEEEEEEEEEEPQSGQLEPESYPVFSSLPQPKFRDALLNPPVSSPNPEKKIVVQLKLPINPLIIKSGAGNVDDDEDDGGREVKKREKSITQPSSVKSFLSSIPAPKNSSSALGAAPTASGSGRRSILEANLPASTSKAFGTESTKTGANPDVWSYDGQWPSASSGDLGNSCSEYAVANSDASGWATANANYENYYSHPNHGSYDDYGQYEHESNWGDGSTAMMPSGSEILGNEAGESLAKISGKRGRNGVPREIVEVKQDELIRNRPREDQVRLTGMAFGPSYKPVSTKGKPTKLHKRKHQIGSLYYDVKQKEMELAERRSKGLLTKAQTQAKYGW